jgi:hypothetical protein
MHAVEDVFSPILLGVFFIATLGICFCGFSIVMVRTINIHLSNFIPSCLLSLFLSLSPSYSPLPSFIYSSFAFPLFIFIVCFMYFTLRFLTSFSHTISYLVASFVLPDYPIPTLNPYLHILPSLLTPIILLS